MLLKTLGLLAVGIVVLALAAPTLARLMLFPAPKVDREVLRSEAHKHGATEIELKTSDGQALYGWRLGDAPRLAVLFSGNGSTVAGYPERYERLVDAGFSVLHVNYRGYPGSSGSPSEEGLLTDSRAIWTEATRTHPPEAITLIGTSLGGGVAVALASEVTPRALVLESTFRSVAQVADEAYPFLPTGRILRDRFDSEARAPRVQCPVLLLHGTEDTIIPVSHSRLLKTRFGRANLIEFVGKGHNEDLLGRPDAWAAFMELQRKAPLSQKD